jgi:hypothetical protein
MMEQLVTIKDWGQPEYLDGAMMQYAVVIGPYLGDGGTVAFCVTLELAKIVAQALGETVIIEGPS